MAAFVAEHNLPFSVMDQLSDLFKEVFPDSAIAVKFKSKHTRTHSSKEIQNGANRNSAERKFSIIIDETTDIASKKPFALVVRYFCERDLVVKSQFFCLIELTNSDATTITTSLIATFEKNKIPLANIIGYASDTTNGMFGEHHSVISQLKSLISDIYVMKCLCHSAHLCASHAW